MTSSLKISFSDTALIARIEAVPEYEDALYQLASRFTSAVRKTSTVIDVNLDDLLTNLISFATWPAPDSVEWEPGLAHLVESVAADAAAVANDLRAIGQPMAEPARELLLGQEWRSTLTKFQERDVRKLLSLNHGANFSVPGAGKTRSTLAAFAAFRRRGEVSKLLIVGPKSAYEAWQDEMAECFGGALRLNIYRDEPSLIGADAVIVNYERLDGNLGRLARWLADNPTLLVLDEAHRMKLGTLGTYGNACLALAPRAKHRMILSGTPAPNGVKDLENLMSFVWPGQGRQAVSRALADNDLRQASQTLKPLFVRTTKKELNLPRQNLLLRPVKLPPLHREIYSALTDQMSSRARGSENDFEALGRVMVYLMMAATSPALLAAGATKYEPLSFRVPPLDIPESDDLTQLMSDLPSYEFSPKYAEVLRIVDRNARLGRKTLVWSTFVRSLTTLERLLARYSPAMVHGGTADRAEEIKRFREDPDCMVLLSNPATLGEGISLHHVCKDAVYVDRDFAAGRFLQSLDRIHRLGLPPDAEVNIDILVSVGTIDEVIASRLAVKLKFMGQILDDPDVELLADPEETEVSAGLDARDVNAMMRHLSGLPF